MQIFHIAEAKRWEAAQLAGSYAQSTLGRTLEDEGFIHACRGDQLDEVRERWYADVTEPLVLLVIDTDRLTSPWSEDPVGETTYPHIHGPLNPAAVVSVLPLGDAQPADAQPADAQPADAPPAVSSTSAAAAAQPAAPASPRVSESTMISAFLGEMTFRMLMAAAVMFLVLVCATVAAGAGLQPLVGALAGFAVGIPLWVVAARRRNQRLDAPPAGHQ